LPLARILITRSIDGDLAELHTHSAHSAVREHGRGFGQSQVRTTADVLSFCKRIAFSDL
jgi:hypothetical protein